MRDKLNDQIKFDSVSICRNGKKAWAIGITGRRQKSK